jgi:hypothetical protein
MATTEAPDGILETTRTVWPSVSEPSCCRTWRTIWPSVLGSTVRR